MNTRCRKEITDMGTIVDIMTLLLLFIIFCWVGSIERKIDMLNDDVIDLIKNNE